MIDLRFDTRPEFYTERLRNATLKAREYLNDVEKTESLIQGIIEWWRLLRKKKRKEPAPLGRLPENETLTKHLEKGAPEILVALHRVATKGALEEVWEDCVASLLIGRALGSTITHKPSLKTFSQVAVFLEINHLAWQEFLSVFQEKINGNKSLKNLWVRLIEEESEPLNNFTERIVTIDTLKEMAKEQNLLINLNPFSCWNKQGRPFPIPFLLERKLDLLRVLDVHAFTNFIENLPLHEIIKTVLQEAYIFLDQDLILNMIRTSQPAYDHNGHWKKKVVSIFLLQIVIQYAVIIKNAIEFSVKQGDIFVQRSAADSDGLDRFCNEELPHWFQKAFGAFLNREDGEFLLKQFSIFLVGSQINSNELKDSRSPYLIAINIIEELFRKRQIGINWLPGEWQGKDDNKEYSALLTYCVLGVEDPKRQWEWYVDLLKRRNENTSLGISAFIPFSDGIGNLIGYRLVLLPKPLTSFKDTWCSLFSERLLARFRIEHDSLSASLHLLAIGKGALRCLLSNAGSHPEDFSLAKEFWIFLYQSYELLYLGYSFQLSQPIHREFITLFSYVPLVFRADWEEAISQAEGILCLDAGVTASVFKTISENGVDKSDLSGTLYGLFGGFESFENNLKTLNQCGFKLYPEIYSYDQLVLDWTVKV